MIINFRYTKWFLKRFLFALSIIANIYAYTSINKMEESLNRCQKHMEEIEQAQLYYATNFENTQQEN